MRVITVNDRMQHGYGYELSAPAGRDFAQEFRPDLTPKEMLALGVFCGSISPIAATNFPQAGLRAQNCRLQAATAR